MSKSSRNPIPRSRKDDWPYDLLQPRQIDMLEEALSSVGEFGEIRLIIEKGRLRFIVIDKSYDALKWHPGMFNMHS